MLTNLVKLKQFILDLFFPLRCVGCGTEGFWVCKKCLNLIKPPIYQKCPICFKNEKTFGEVCKRCKSKTYLDGIFVVAIDKDKILRKLIHLFKYNQVKEIGYCLGNIMLKNFIKVCITNQDCLVIPVPLHHKRLKWRGFNQAGVVAEEVAVFMNFLYRPKTLIRKRYTKPQAKLKRKDRLENLESAFSVNLSISTDQEVILVDDVTTTGTTLNECAKALKKNGVRRVWGLVLTRGT